MSTPPPPDDHLEATVATPRVEPPPPPPRRQVGPAVVEPVIPRPTVTVVPPVRQYDFGHPFGYVCARFFAFVLDLILIAGVVTSLAYSLIAVNPITGLPTNTEPGFDATLALGIAVALVYVWIAEAFTGTTIGKLALGLRVYAVHGGAVGLGRAFVRGVLRPIDLLLVGGVLAMLPVHRRVGDFAGGTIVANSTLRGFGPVLGWILTLIAAGIPFILAGPALTFRSLVAFYLFVPPMIVHAWTWLQGLFGPR